MMKLTDADSHKPHVEPMLSLINVVFLLLIFFLVVGHISSAEQAELELLHTTHKQPTLEIPEHDWLYVDQFGGISYHNQALTLTQLAAHFTPDQRIHIAVDSSLSMGRLDAVIAKFKQLNIQDISLVTRIDPEGK